MSSCFFLRNDLLDIFIVNVSLKKKIYKINVGKVTSYIERLFNFEKWVNLNFVIYYLMLKIYDIQVSICCKLAEYIFIFDNSINYNDDFIT